jgi:hypothetical protein
VSGEVRGTGCTVPGLAIAVAVAVVNVVLVNHHRVLFPVWWRQVMWEGGVLEGATALAFLTSAVLFGWAAVRAGPGGRRWWLVVFSAGALLLLGEETNYGGAMLMLDLDAPDFAERYNPQSGTLHNVGPYYLPLIVYFVLVAALRLRPRLRRRLRLPLPEGFLNATLLTVAAGPFMRWAPAHRVFVDEVYEWSSAVLIACLGLHAVFGWFFRGPAPASPERP